MEGKMATDVRYTNGLMNGQLRSAIASVGRFLLHFVLMFASMMIGMMPYHAIFGKSPVGNTILWYAGMELSMIPGMAVLMLYQRHGWRSSLEMAGAMLVGPAIILSCAQLGWHNYIPGLSLNTVVGFADSAMFLGMLADMLYRRDMYTSPHANHQHTGHAELTTHTY
jgi:hypothetical protein